MSAIHTFIKWFRLISLPIQSDESLEHANNLLNDFDTLKRAFSGVENCSEDLPKMHAMAHYVSRIREWGTPDNYDTEFTEHQHINSKKMYKKTNRINAERQMAIHAQRRMALEMKFAYLEICATNTSSPPLVSSRTCSLGSRVRNSPMLISDASRIFECKDLELCIRSYIHDCQFPKGEGKRHRVKRSKLPELDDEKVNYIALS